MVVFPHCKINLGLHVLRKRPDGYHDLETCFYPVPWNDILEVIPSAEFSLTTSGTAIPGREEDNQCVRAYALLNATFNISPVKIHLHKSIPTGAGLGGGSSNGSFTLRALNQVFNLGLSPVDLRGYAAQLGSDSAFFSEDKPMIGAGRGEILTETSLSLKNYFLILVKPDIHVSTAEAYAGIQPAVPAKALSSVLQSPVEQWRNNLVNDFEPSVFKKYPAIESIKSALYQHGAVYASMSGSGSSVFGIFKSPVDLSAQFPGMHYWAGELS